MNVRTVVALLAAPLSAAIVYSLVTLATMPQTTPEHAAGFSSLFVPSVAVAAIFEAFVLLPLWYVLRGATVGARLALWLLGVLAWFLATAGLGFLLGHGGTVALRFGMSLLLPGVVVAAVFAALVPPRSNA